MALRAQADVGDFLVRLWRLAIVDGDASGAVTWLLGSAEPAVRMMTRRDVLGERVDAEDVMAGPWVQALLAGQQPDGGFGVHWYRKWTGGHWRLVQLVELEIPPGEPRAVAAANVVLNALTRPRRQVNTVHGLPLSDASIEGNALAVACRLGLTRDPRAAQLADWLVEWQWPDGGWNCDRSATGRRSSFHESLSTMWGLHEYGQATDDAAAIDAAHRAAELFLEHRLFRSLRTGEVINRRWLQPCYPSYWHYDIGRALLVLSRMGLLGDPRTADALDELEHRRGCDGRWSAGPQWWKPGGGNVTPDAVDWGRTGDPNPMITLNALRILRAAGRL
jgi:hypothetical protein